MRTLRSEHGVEFYNDEQNHFYENFARDISISKSLMREEIRACSSI